MAFTAPTAAELKARYPAFAGVADGTVTAALADAGLDVGESWISAHRAPAILSLAAHRMVAEGMLASAEAMEFTGGLGTVTELRAGDSTIKFASADKSEVVEATGYARTPYGRRYLELRARSFPPVLII